MINKVSIAVIGCGWFGFPFATHMIGRGYKIRGTTTKQDKLNILNDAGIDSYLSDMSNEDNLRSVLKNVDFLVINIPPGRRDPINLEKYPRLIEKIIHQTKESSTLKKVVFISSTSVYGYSEHPIDESVAPYAETASGKAIIEAEKVVMESRSFVILRFGGLAGPGRHPGRFLAGRKDVPGGNHSINFLHLQDAIKVVEHIVDSNEINQIFNVAAPSHPSKRHFYNEMAKSANLVPPTFQDSPFSGNKEINVDKLMLQAGYEFVYPDPMKFTFKD